MKVRFGENYTVVPLMIIEAATTGYQSNYVKVNNTHWVTFLVCSGDADTALIFTVESSSANVSNASETTIPFLFRKSGAASAGSDTWSAITSADSTGHTFTEATDVGKMLIIDINPNDLADGHNYLRVCMAATSINVATMVATSVVAVLESRYSQKEHLSTT